MFVIEHVNSQPPACILLPGIPTMGDYYPQGPASLSSIHLSGPGVLSQHQKGDWYKRYLSRKQNSWGRLSRIFTDSLDHAIVEFYRKILESLVFPKEPWCLDGETGELAFPQALGQGFSAFLMLWPFSTVLYAVVTLDHKVILLLLHNCNFTTVMNCNVNVWDTGYLICDSQRGRDPQVENCCSRQFF